MTENTLRRLRVLAFIEGSSLLVLVGIAVPLKHALGVPLPVRVVGPLHGLAFLAYVVSVVDALGTRRLDLRHAGLAIVAAMIPGGSFLFARFVVRLAAKEMAPARASADHERDVSAPRPRQDHVPDVVVSKDADERT